MNFRPVHRPCGVLLLYKARRDVVAQRALKYIGLNDVYGSREHLARPGIYIYIYTRSVDKIATRPVGHPRALCVARHPGSRPTRRNSTIDGRWINAGGLTLDRVTRGCACFFSPDIVSRIMFFSLPIARFQIIIFAPSVPPVSLTACLVCTLAVRC